MARYCENLEQAYWKAVDKILEYQGGALSVGITYSRKSGHHDNLASEDADNATGLEAEQSVSERVKRSAPAAVQYFSRMQRVMALSIEDTKCVVTNKIVRELAFLA